MVALFLLSCLQADPGIQELIEGLRSEQLEDRERASRALEKIGPAAILDLEKAAKDQDPEKADRAAQILDRIDARIESPILEELAALLKKPERDAAEDQRVEVLARKLVPRREATHPSGLVSVRSTEGRRFLLEESPIGFSIPGNPVYLFHVLDRQGRRLGGTWIAAGNRQITSGTSVVKVEEFGEPLVRVDVCDIMLSQGETEERQYYAIRKNELVLVRLETASGKPFRNLYAYAGNVKGPSVPSRTAREWRDALRSPDAAEVHQALTWLSGTHRNPRAPGEGGGDQAIADARLVDEVRENEREFLKSLLTSKNRWAREAAPFALTPAYLDR